MDESFDPYLKWLGIRDSRRPPDHYRLLGLELFEEDLDVIATGADRQMAHVRRFQNGDHLQVSQQLLNELASARICLLQRDKRMAYDEQLRTGSPTKPVAANSPIENSSHPLSVRGRLPSGRVLWIALGSIGLIVVLLATHALFSTDPNDSTGADPTLALVEPGNDANPEQADVTIYEGPLAEGSPPRVSDSNAATPVERAVDEEAPVTVESDNQANLPGAVASVDHSHNQDTDTAPVDETLDPANEAGTDEGGSHREADGPEANDPRADDPENDDPENDDPRADDPEDDDPEDDDPEDPEDEVQQERPPTIPAENRVPVPDKAARSVAEAQVAKIYGEKLKNRDPMAQLELIRELIDEGAATDEDSPARYVMLWSAADLAARLGHYSLVFLAVDRLAASFEIDAMKRKGEILENRTSRRETVPHRVTLVLARWKLAEMAIMANRFELADAQLKASIRSARTNLKSRQLADSLDALLRKSNHNSDLFRALPTGWMSEGPGDDRTLNRRIGEFLCFAQGDFKAGLPYLALCDIVRLAKIVEFDLDGSPQADQQKDLGDQWYDFGDKHADRTVRMPARQRARTWYERALPRLRGISAAATRQRIEDIDRERFASSLDQARIAAKFSTNSWIELRGFMFTGDTPLTVEAFVRPASSPRGGAPATILGNADASGFRLAAQNGKWIFQVHDGTTFQTAMSTETLFAGRWVHLAGVYDQKQRRVVLYVDGKRQQRIVRAVRYKASNLPLLVGANATARGGGESFFRGQIRDLRISSIARYTSTQFTPPPVLALDANTVALLPLNGRHGQEATDALSPSRPLASRNVVWVSVDR